MKKLLMVSKGEHFATQLFRTIAVLLVSLGLALTFWTATMPLAEAQNMTPQQMIQAELPQGRTMANANKNQFTTAVCAAVRRNRTAAPQIARAAIAARPELKEDTMRALFRCLGDEDCELLGRVYRQFVSADPNNTSATHDLAVQLAPGCADAFGAADEGGFGGGTGNQNPPPGSIGGGGGGQGGRCQVCHNGNTLTVSCNAVPAHVRHGDTEGPCVVTPTQNP